MARWTEFKTVGFTSSFISNQNNVGSEDITGYRRTPETGLGVRDENIRICFKRRKNLKPGGWERLWGIFRLRTRQVQNLNIKILNQESKNSTTCKINKAGSSFNCWIRVRIFRWIDVYMTTKYLNPDPVSQQVPQDRQVGSVVGISGRAWFRQIIAVITKMCRQFEHVWECDGSWVLSVPWPAGYKWIGRTVLPSQLCTITKWLPFSFAL